HYGLVGSGGSGELSETEPLEEGSNYILDLIDTPPVQLLETEGLNDWLTGEDPLLAVLLRHALLLEYADALYNLLEEAQLPLPRRREPELLGISRSPTPYTAWRLFHEPDPAERTRTIARRLYEERFARMGSYLESLNSLANVPTAELHRLLTETLDTVSHRIDAWITSVAARRLDEMRANETLGCHLGAFGWLEHVRPNGTSTAFSGGFVHAPSTAQATAAAVLASASQTHQFKVRLSSRSVRAGLSLIEGLRAGLPIGAMLGVHVEHTLFERDLARYVAPLRAIYPLVPSNPNVPTETPVALNVVDGLALRRSWLDDTFDWEQEGLPNTNEEEFDRLFSALNEVFGKGEGEKIDAVDAMTDLLTAESVYQMILGNQDSANAAFNALTRDGTTPPIPQVVQTPHRHIDITHRVALLLDEREPEGWRTTRTPRAEVEPILDGWVGNLFGDPKDIFASVTIPTPTQTDLKARQIVDVSLEALEVRPLDILFMTDGELNARITTAALVELNELDLDVRGARVNEAPADRSRTLSDIRALSTALKAALGGGRSFRPTDLSPMNIESDKAVQRSALQRVSTAITRVESLVADLNEYTVTVEETIEAADNIDGVRIDTSDLRNALSQAALYGVEGVFPNTLASQEGDQVSVARTFVELAKGAMNKLNQRLNEVGQINRNEVNAAERIAATLFGSFVLLPRIANPDWPAYEEAPHPYIADTEFESRYRVDQWATQVSHAHSLM
ncbi:MAG: hypothetical protein IH587_13425, partial [Anaerolineae bacterium]|nr:hypothetical protein [Anaerolineae bacterium]